MSTDIRTRRRVLSEILAIAAAGVAGATGTFYGIDPATRERRRDARIQWNLDPVEPPPLPPKTKGIFATFGGLAGLIFATSASILLRRPDKAAYEEELAEVVEHYKQRRAERNFPSP